MPLPNIGFPELIIILVIALLILGPGKLPEVGSALGKSIREFRKAAGDVEEATNLNPTPSPSNAAPQPPAQPAPQVSAPAPAQPAPQTGAPAQPAAPASQPPAPNVLNEQATPNEVGSQPQA